MYRFSSSLFATVPTNFSFTRIVLIERGGLLFRVLAIAIW